MSATAAQKNGKVSASPPPVAAPDLVHQALTQLIQMSQQTNHHLQQLTGEISTMNQQLFGGPVRPYQPPQPAATPQPGPVATVVPGDQPQTGWRKEIIKSTCSQVGITKTLSLSKWKLNFYVDGEGRPASAYGRRPGEFASLIQRVRAVFPEISPDHFSVENFTQRNKEYQDAGSEGNYEELFIAPEPFTVEWYEKPGGNGKTYAYIERVYTIA